MNTPPQGWTSTTTDTVIIALFSIWLVVLAAWALWNRRPRRRAQLAILVVSCTAASLTEAANDFLVNAQHFHSRDALIIYSAFGREISVGAVLGYAAAGGTMAFLALVALDRGWSNRGLWKIFSAIAVVDFITEAFLIRLGMYVYYGSQPLQLFRVPFTWPFIYPVSFMVIGLALQRFMAHVRGARLLLFVPMGAGLYFGAAVFAGWPTMLGAGMNLDTPAMTVLGAVSVVLVSVSFAGLIKWLNRSPVVDAPGPVPAVDSRVGRDGNRNRMA